MTKLHAIIPVAEAVQSAERLLEIIKEAGGRTTPYEGVEGGVVALWNVLDRLAKSGGGQSGEDFESDYILGAGIHDLSAKINAVWGRNGAIDTILAPHLRELGETTHIGQNASNPRWDRKDGKAREHGSADKVIELYWACLCILAGMNVELDDPIHSSAGKNPDVLATVKDGTRWGFAIKTLSETASPENAAKNLLTNIEKGLRQIEAAACDKGFVVVNAKNIIDHEAIRTLGPFANHDLARKAVEVEIMKTLAPFYNHEAAALKPWFISRTSVAPFVVLLAHTTAIVNAHIGKSMFAEMRVMFGSSIPTVDRHPPGTYGREAEALAGDLNDLMQTTT